MKKHLGTLRDSVNALRRAWVEALPALVIPGSDAQAAVGSMSDAGLVRVMDAASFVVRTAIALQTVIAAEIGRRSAKELGHDGLAARHGFGSPEALLAQSAGTSRSDAAKLVSVGDATRERESFTGERMPSRHPHVHAALHAGVLSVAAAAMITGMLDRVAVRADAEALDAAENRLVANAAEFSIEMLARLVKREEAYLDPDGVRPREDELRDARSCSVIEDASGAIVLRGRFDPVSGALIKQAIDAVVSTELRRARDAFGSGSTCSCSADMPPEACTCHDPAIAENRSMTQMRADALTDLLRHALGCRETVISESQTLVVRMDVVDLRNPDSVGTATIDGIDTPISAESARSIAATAGIIPLVLGGASVPLDLGRTQRLFTRAQKLALAERDGGCAFPNCSRPPGFTEAHHVRWWDRDAGPTDLDNGVLLCSQHHHLLHREEWVIRIVDGHTWFIPPAHIDVDQRPRPGNSLRRELGCGSPGGGDSGVPVRADVGGGIAA